MHEFFVEGKSFEMLNKGSENCYLFILRYGHLDLLTSMYRVSVWRWSSAMGR
jgi:hypothetical protein